MFYKKFLILGLLLLAIPADAATIYIDPGLATLNRGDAITAAVRLMPDKDAGECINVIDAIVTYTENIQPVDVSIGKSIVSVWVEQPIINKENRTITFAGGIPNGYCGRVDGDPRLTNVIAEIIFRSPGMQVGGGGEADAKVDFAPETQVLLNDGSGTRAPLSMLGATFSLSKTAGSSGIIDDWREVVRNDNIAPESFSIELVKDEDGLDFGGRYYIIFNTSDKQSGLSHYEIMEEPVLEFSQFKWGGVGVPWVKHSSPYVLKDQSLNSIIRVKAIDKAGNEYIATYIPEESQRTLSQNELYTYIFFGLLGFGLLIISSFTIFWWKRRKRKLANSANDLLVENNEE